MLVTLLAASLLTASAADDYFPLTPGSKRTYEETGSGQKIVSVDVVGDPVDVGGKKTIPVKTSQPPGPDTTTFYRSEEDGVYLIGYDPQHPLPKPMPYLVLNENRGAWHYSGANSDSKSSALVSVYGEAMPKGERNVLGKKTAVIEVHLVTVVNQGLLHSYVDQVSIYGKGIGLVETVTKIKEGRSESKVTTRLVKLEEAKATG